MFSHGENKIDVILPALREIRDRRHLNLLDFSRAVVTRLKTMISGSGCAVMLIEGSKSKMIAQEGLSDDALGIQIRVDSGALGALRHSQGSIQEQNNSAGVLSALIPANRGAKSVMCTPIIHDDVVVGVIYLDSQAEDAFQEEDLFYAELMAAEISLALQRSLLEARVKELDKMDGLTGCLNLRSLQEDIKTEIARSKRYEKKFSLCYLEIGGLEDVSGSCPQEKRQNLLNVTVALIRRNIRNIDKIYHIENDRFVILLPETSKVEAISVANRLIEMVDQASGDLERASRPEGHLTIGSGICGYPEDGNFVMELLDSADAALRQAMARGGNGLCVAGEGAPEPEAKETVESSKN